MKPNAIVNAELNHVFRNAAIPNVGDAAGLQPSAAAGNVSVNLHTAWPGQGGTAETSVSAYANYAAVNVSRTAGFSAAANGAIVAAAAVEFPEAGAGAAETLCFWSVSGVGGAILRMGALGGAPASCTAKAGTDLVSSPGLAAAAPPIANGDRVVFWALPGGSVPTGLTEGVVYFARDVAGADFKVAATLGGAAVDITADGGCLVQRVVAIQVSEGVKPTIPALTMRG